VVLREAHEALEAMSKAANAVKGKEWEEAERALIEVQDITRGLLRKVGDKRYEARLAPLKRTG
jgi:flagellin-specific chaperone FliS